MRRVEIQVAYHSMGISTEFIPAPGMRKVVAVVALLAHIAMIVVEKVNWVNSGRALSAVSRFQRVGP